MNSILSRFNHNLVSFHQICGFFNLTRTDARSSLRLRFAFSTIWSLIGAIVSQIMGMLVTIIAARLLGKVGYGQYGIINSTVGMFGLVSGMGLGVTATKYIAQYKEKDPDRVGRIIGLSIIVALFTSTAVSIALFFFSPLLAQNMLNNPNLAPILQKSSLFLFLSSINGVLVGTLAGFEAFKAIAKINIFQGLLEVPIMLVTIGKWGLEGAVYGLIIVAVFSIFFSYFFLKQECAHARVTIHYRMFFREIPLLWKFSLPAFLNSTISAPVIWGTGALLVNQPNGYAEMGVFNAANQWRTLLAFFPAMLGQAILPMQSALYSNNDLKSSRKVFFLAVTSCAVITIPILVLLILFNNEVMSLYGEDFHSRGHVFIIITMMGAIAAMMTPVGQLVTATGRMWLGFSMNLGWAIVLFISAFLLINQGKGADGLAMAYFVAYLFHGIWTTAIVTYLLKKRGTPADEKHLDD